MFLRGEDVLTVLERLGSLDVTLGMQPFLLVFAYLPDHLVIEVPYDVKMVEDRLIRSVLSMVYLKPPEIDLFDGILAKAVITPWVCGIGCAEPLDLRFES